MSLSEMIDVVRHGFILVNTRMTEVFACKYYCCYRNATASFELWNLHGAKMRKIWWNEHP